MKSNLSPFIRVHPCKILWLLVAPPFPALSTPPKAWQYRSMDKDKTIRRYRIGSIILFGFLAFFALAEIPLPAPADCVGVESGLCALTGIWKVFTDLFYPVVLVFSAGVAVWILKRTAFSRDLPE